MVSGLEVPAEADISSSDAGVSERERQCGNRRGASEGVCGASAALGTVPPG